MGTQGDWGIRGWLTFWVKADGGDDGRVVEDAETLALEDVPKAAGLVRGRREDEEILNERLKVK